MLLSRLSVAALLAFAGDAKGDFGLAGQLFQLEGSSAVNNAKLAWANVNGATTYRIEQNAGNGDFQEVGNTTGNTYDVYGLQNAAYDFRVTALNGNSQVDQSSLASLTTFAAQGRYNTYDNTQPSPLLIKSKLEANGIYYRYNYESGSDRSFERFVEQTSQDGYNFSGDKTVLTREVLCASVNNNCKLEAIQFLPHPTTGEFVMWAHFERTADYGLGQVAVAHVTPGGEMTFDGTFRPLNDDSRDMNFFADGNNAYLTTSTNTNSDNNIYSLDSRWTAVSQRLAKVNVNQHREAPAVIKSNGWFYLFTSRAAGWLPSQPQYIAAQNMAGPWSDPVNVGNTATFCAQSGGVNELSNGQYEMHANRWSANWPTPGGPTRPLMLPISSNGGAFSSYHFYPTVQYSDDISTPGQAMYGVQSGRILSVGKPSSSNAGTQDIALANDGIQDTPGRFFVPNAVPFWYEIDLQDEYVISQVDLSTNMVSGSETFYRFTVAGSTDGSSWTTLVDQSKNTDVGFKPSFPTSTERFRYVRINVDAVINNINGNAANWAVGVSELTVYGN